VVVSWILGEEEAMQFFCHVMISSRCICFYGEKFCKRVSECLDEIHDNSLSLKRAFSMVQLIYDISVEFSCSSSLSASLSLILFCESVEFVISGCFPSGTGHCLVVLFV